MLLSSSSYLFCSGSAEQPSYRVLYSFAMCTYFAHITICSTQMYEIWRHYCFCSYCPLTIHLRSIGIPPAAINKILTKTKRISLSLSHSWQRRMYTRSNADKFMHNLFAQMRVYARLFVLIKCHWYNFFSSIIPVSR